MIVDVIDQDTVFVFGTTVRRCIDCGIAVAGGPTRCMACAGPGRGIVLVEYSSNVEAEPRRMTHSACGRFMVRTEHGPWPGWRCEHCRVTRPEPRATVEVEPGAVCDACHGWTDGDARDGLGHLCGCSATTDPGVDAFAARMKAARTGVGPKCPDCGGGLKAQSEGWKCCGVFYTDTEGWEACGGSGARGTTKWIEAATAAAKRDNEERCPTCASPIGAGEYVCCGVLYRDGNALPDHCHDCGTEISDDGACLCGWHEVTVTLRYHDDALTPGGVSRNEPSNVDELVVEIDREVNAATFCGLVGLKLAEPPHRCPDCGGLTDPADRTSPEDGLCYCEPVPS